MAEANASNKSGKFPLLVMWQLTQLPSCARSFHKNDSKFTNNILKCRGKPFKLYQLLWNLTLNRSTIILHLIFLKLFILLSSIL